MAKSNNSTSGLDPHQQSFIKLILESGYRHRPYDVFRDFCELLSLSLSNVVDKFQFAAREARYMEVIGKYDREEMNRFLLMREHVVESFEVGFKDCLGELFMALDFGDDRKGQFFTPYPLCRLMAKMTLGDAGEMIGKKGFFTLNEPAAGGGAMVIASAHALKEQGINYQQHMHVIAQDIDLTAVHMTYIQLALLHVPAIVVHGNSLWPEKTWGHWVTPAHVWGFWDAKLLRARTERSDMPAIDQEAPPAMEAARAVIVQKRIEQANQLSLFDLA